MRKRYIKKTQSGKQSVKYKGKRKKQERNIQKKCAKKNTGRRKI